MRKLVPLLVLPVALALALAAALPASAQEGRAPLKIATKEAAPFAYKDAQGRWTGLSIDLWRRVTEEAKLPPPTFVELSLAGMLEAVQKGEVDAAIAAITVTAERERRMDFSHAYFDTGVGVAVSGRARGVLAAIEPLLSLELLGIVGAILLSLVMMGYLFWRAERAVNPAYRDETAREGFAFGVWWALVMLLGHKGIFPKSMTGRLLAAGCMIASLLLLTVLIGAVAQVATLSQLERRVRVVEDLRWLRVVAVEGTSSEAFLRGRRLPARPVADLGAALALLAEGEADAVVHDEAVLRWHVARDGAGRARVVPVRFDRQQYAVALPEGSALREQVNQALLDITASDEWRELVYRYVGGPS